MMIRFTKYNIDETGMAVPRGGLKKEALDVRALTEAQMYSPHNPYLDDKQKNICEVWYNLPSSSFVLSFLFFSSIAIGIKPVFAAIYTSLLSGWLLTTLNKGMMSRLIPINYFLLANPFSTIALILLTFILGKISWLSALGLLIIHITGLFTPGHMVSDTWAIVRHPGLNSRYGSAKELFKIEFPFEEYLPQNKTLLADNRAHAIGQQVLVWVMLFIVVFSSVVWGGA